MQTRSSLRLACPALAALAVLLAGCSGGGSGPARGAGVASVTGRASQAPTSGAAQPSASAGVEPRGPQLRVDTSEAETLRLMTIWSECLRSNGVPTYEKTAASSEYGMRVILPKGRPQDYPGQFKACADKEPVQPAALDPKRNPHYSDNKRDWIKCINRKSPIIKVIETEDGYTFADSTSRSDEIWKKFEEVSKNCQYEAFGRE